MIVLKTTINYLYAEFDMPVSDNKAFMNFWMVYPACKPLWDLFNSSKIVPVLKFPKVRIMFAIGQYRHEDIKTAWGQAEVDFLATKTVV